MLANLFVIRPHAFTIAAGLTLLVGVYGAAAATEGWFTEAQATQGHQLFNNQCAECHRPDLTGAAGPALVGPTFLAKWGNKPLSDLYSFEHQNMPANNPGSAPCGISWWPSRLIFLHRRTAFKPETRRSTNGRPPGRSRRTERTGLSRDTLPFHQSGGAVMAHKCRFPPALALLTSCFLMPAWARGRGRRSRPENA